MAQFKPEMPPPVLLATVAIALLASLLTGRERAEAEPAPPAARAAPPISLAGFDVERLRLATRLEPAPTGAPGPLIDTSAVIGSVLETPPPPLPRRAPPAPSAPPLPFSYLGKMIDGDKTLVFVGRGADHYSAEPGLKIDETYKVEKVTDTAVTFVFLPSGTRQVLAVPSLSE